MATHLIARNLGLKVPHFLQGERLKQNMYSMLATAAFTRSRREMRTLLRDISFEVPEGDRVAIMGRNGAGKTTLLRVMTGAFQPTEGVLDVQGSRQALLNLGLGFNQEATVRENVYLRAIAMGMPVAQIQEIMGQVLEFAELGDVLNHRLLTLSSGQRMRLGFAISTAVQHDIMLLDEWLGAGDAGFVEKARKRMTDRVDGSKIVMLASHNFPLLRKVCNKGLVLERGELVYFGEIEPAIVAYKKIYQADPAHIASRSE
ncbi:ABC transporter ATP-binding protein [Luteimonas mephitis]|uniref:ABC transporter ATP-binding protein n=1 Tax=Luteimonas mephitis TaxID=83615 RepID=UPI003A93309D